MGQVFSYLSSIFETEPLSQLLIKKIDGLNRFDPPKNFLDAADLFKKQLIKWRDIFEKATRTSTPSGLAPADYERLIIGTLKGIKKDITALSSTMNSMLTALSVYRNDFYPALTEQDVFDLRSIASEYITEEYATIYLMVIYGLQLNTELMQKTLSNHNNLDEIQRHWNAVEIQLETSRDALKEQRDLLEALNNLTDYLTPLIPGRPSQKRLYRHGN